MRNKYFIGITGISTAGKSTLASTLLSAFIQPNIFAIPHTTRRKSRSDDDVRLLKCLSESEYSSTSFLTIDEDYGTSFSDFNRFLTSNYQIAVSIVSCNEVPELDFKLPQFDVFPVFVSLTLTKTLENEIKVISERFPKYFTGEDLKHRIERDNNLAKKYFFNNTYISKNNPICLSHLHGGIIDWLYTIQKIVPFSFSPQIEKDILTFMDVRKKCDVL